jgi:hypothetical protein
VSGLTAIGHLDVYSLSRESLQRMLPAPATNGSANGQRAASTSAPPTDTRQFQYRFSLPYVRSLPEAQRPVEREVFGESLGETACSLRPLCAETHRTVLRSATEWMADDRVLRLAGVREC